MPVELERAKRAPNLGQVLLRNYIVSLLMAYLLIFTLTYGYVEGEKLKNACSAQTIGDTK